MKTKLLYTNKEFILLTRNMICINVYFIHVCLIHMIHYFSAGFHTREECDRYYKYLMGTRKQQYAADTTVWRSPPKLPVRPKQFQRRPRAQEEVEETRRVNTGYYRGQKSKSKSSSLKKYAYHFLFHFQTLELVSPMWLNILFILKIVCQVALNYNIIQMFTASRGMVKTMPKVSSQLFFARDVNTRLIYSLLLASLSDIMYL